MKLPLESQSKLRREEALTRPIIFQHAETLFNALKENAVDGIYTGHITNLAKKEGVPLGYYGDIIFLLESGKYIAQITRGARYKESVWRVLREKIDFTQMKENTPWKNKQGRIYTLEYQIKDLNRAVDRLQTQVRQLRADLMLVASG